MATDLTPYQIRKVLRNEFTSDIDRFKIIKAISLYAQNNEIGQELILRLLSRKKDFEGYEEIVDSLVKRAGLYPYIGQEALSFNDSIAFEFHKPKGLADNIVFHHAQAEVFYSLMKGENIILSAPTSFGKSLIIDAVIASKKHNNIAVIVPTIALIDETRKRLSKYRDNYKIITHPSQSFDSQNILILTQERAITIIDDVHVDFFIIDEFYKLSPTKTNNQRAYILNHVFYQLVKQKAQFYLLGPNIEQITTELLSNVKFRFIKTDFKTVISERHKIEIGKDEKQIDKLIDLTSNLQEPTLIFCQSPASVNRVANKLLSNGDFESRTENYELAEWIKANYHEKWILASCLEKGIGLHHGKIPRSIAQKSIKLFNNGRINFLICTSTIIEGVNTKAKNVIIYDNKIASSKFDFFTYNNICGRSGRMFSHYIGNIYLFHEPPTPELPLVDFPIFSQNDEAPAELLINLEKKDIKKNSRKKLEKYYNQESLPVNILNENSFIELDYQIELAEFLRKRINKTAEHLTWKNIPSNYQLKVACVLIWNFFIRNNKRIYGVSSGRQLHFRINQFKKAGNLKSYIDEFVGTKLDFEEINKQIELALDIQRHWINFQFPRYLRALNSISNFVLKEQLKDQGDFSNYASMVECYFTRPYVIPLDEYGLPFQISLKIGEQIELIDDIDDSLSTIKELNPENVELDPIEKEFIYELKEYL